MSILDRLHQQIERARFADFCPVRYEERGLYRMQDGHIGRCYLAMPISGASQSTQRALETMLDLDFPTGTIIQFQNWALPGSMDTVQQWTEDRATTPGHARAKALDAMISELFNEFRFKPPFNNGKSGATRFLLLAIKIPADGDIDRNPEELATLEALMSQFVEGLQVAGLHYSGVNAQTYLNLMSHLFDPWEKYGPEYSDTRYINEQLEVPGNRISLSRKRGLHFRRQRIDGTVSRVNVGIISVARWPKRTTLALMNHLIGDPSGLQNQISVPHVLSSSIRYFDRADGLAEVKKKAAVVAFNSIGNSMKWMPGLKAKADGFQILLQSVEADKKRLVGVATGIILVHPSRKQLDLAIGRTLAYYGSLGVFAGKESFITFPSLTNHLPLWPTFASSKGLSRNLTLSTAQAAQFLPVFGDWIGTTSPSAKGHLNGMLMLTRRNEPCSFNVFSPAHASPNFVMVAQTGGGKSFAAQYMVETQLALGTRVWVMDAGRSYLKLAAALNGDFRALTVDSDICLNPFTHVTIIEEDMPILTVCIMTMCDRSGDMFRGERGALMKGTLASAIRSCWTTYGNSLTVDHIYKFCQSQDNEVFKILAATLFDFSRQGPYGRWFNGQNNLQIDNVFTVLELEELKRQPDLQAVVLQMLVTQVSQQIYMNEGQRKMLVIDEALGLVKDPMMREFLEEAYEKFRKYGASIGLIAQDLVRLLNSPPGDAIRANAFTTFMLEQSSGTINKVKADAVFDLDEYTWQQIRDLHTVKGRYSEMMIVTKVGSGVVRIVLPAYHQLLYSSDADERTTIFDALKRGEDIDELILARVERDLKAKSARSDVRTVSTTPQPLNWSAEKSAEEADVAASWSPWNANILLPRGVAATEVSIDSDADTNGHPTTRVNGPRKRPSRVIAITSTLAILSFFAFVAFATKGLWFPRASIDNTKLKQPTSAPSTALTPASTPTTTPPTAASTTPMSTPAP